MLNLKIIIASTRPGRKGPAVANWFYDIAAKHPAFNTELLDLAKINLPFLDEAQHPRLKKYERQHTKDWSAMIDGGDAYVIVTAEYNFGFPAPLKNALDFLYQEWTYKPVAFVSYGGISGGTRAVQMLKQVVTAQKMMPMAEGVHIPAFTKHINEQGIFAGDEHLDKSATDMLTELARWGEALKPMRQKQG
ncbi:MAG: NAD(P)H-dependent oxidoreductase [Bacteroidota bacterium]